jgi:hypothetical protein
MKTEKLLSQTDLAKELAISDRRVRQLEERGVVIRHPEGGYDIHRNRRRYRLFIDRDLEGAANGDGGSKKLVSRSNSRKLLIDGHPGSEIAPAYPRATYNPLSPTGC